MRVLVCGGRDYHDYETLTTSLDKLHAKYPIELIIEGGAKGADAHAATWAKNKGIQWVTAHANWHFYNGAAGPIRNKNMRDLLNPDCVVAFPGGTGTAGMIKLARESKINVWVIDGT